MTVTAERRAIAAPAEPARSPLASGAAAALWAALLGLAVVAVPVVLVWVTAPHDQSGPGDALRGGVLAWLLAHHATLRTTSGPLGLVPLGLLAVPAVLLYRSGRWAGRVAGSDGTSSAVATALALVATYATVLSLVASVSADPATGVAGGSALAGAVGCAGTAGVAGVLRGSGRWSALVGRVPADLRLVARAGLAGVAALVAGAAVVLVAALAASGGRIVGLTEALDAGPLGGPALLVLQLLALPSAVVWSAAYAIGPGFAVGAGTVVAPSGVLLGAVPSFPLLGVLPGSGPAPRLSLLALLVPVGAGVVVAAVLARRPEHGLARAVALALAAGAVVGLAIGLLAGLSAGSLGDGRLAVLGPDALRVGLVATVEVGAIAAVVLVEGRRQADRLHRLRSAVTGRWSAGRLRLRRSGR